MPTLTEVLSNRGRPASAVRSAVKADLKAARRRLYDAQKLIDQIIVIADDADLVERARPILAAVRRVPIDL